MPEVLLSGHTANVARWRREQALRRTFERRPKLLQRANLSDEDWAFVEKLQAEHDKAMKKKSSSAQSRKKNGEPIPSISEANIQRKTDAKVFGRGQIVARTSDRPTRESGPSRRSTPANARRTAWDNAINRHSRGGGPVDSGD